MPATGYKSQGAGPDHRTSGHAKPTEIPPTISLINPSPSRSSFLPSRAAVPAGAATSSQWNQGNHTGPSQATFTTNHHRHTSLLKHFHMCSLVQDYQSQQYSSFALLTPAQTCADFWGVLLPQQTSASPLQGHLCDTPSQEAACSQLYCKPCQFPYLHQNT